MSRGEVGSAAAAPRAGARRRDGMPRRRAYARGARSRAAAVILIR